MTELAEQVLDADDVDDAPEGPESGTAERRFGWKDRIVFIVLPLVILALGTGAGYLKFQDYGLRSAEVAGIESVQAASEGAVAMLSYSPDTVADVLKSATERLTGPFRDSYGALIDAVVIPGATAEKISATATVPAVASVSATDDHAVAMVYVNQTTIIGDGAPTNTASVVQVTLDKVGGRWLISGFEPK